MRSSSSAEPSFPQVRKAKLINDTSDRCRKLHGGKGAATARKIDLQDQALSAPFGILRSGPFVAGTNPRPQQCWVGVAWFESKQPSFGASLGAAVRPGWQDPDMDHQPDEMGSASSGYQPDPKVRLEFEQYLDADRTALGDVWRQLAEGHTAEQIAESRDAATTGFVWSYKRIMKCLLEGDLPSAPTVALGSARALRRIRSTGNFSDEANATLDASIAALELRSDNPAARDAEERAALRSTGNAEASGQPGIYVYALPHYLRYPYDPESGHTLLKVGRSDRDVIARLRSQTRTTAIPEEPILLRIYTSESRELTNIERSIHRLLVAADHDRSAARTGGTEWFLTSLRFLDAVADEMALGVLAVNDEIPAD